MNYKLLVILAIAAALLATVRRGKLFAWSVYIFFYPLTRLFFALLYGSLAIIKMRSWAILFSALNLLFSFLASWKPNFIVLVLTAISVALVLTSNNSVLLALAVVAVFGAVLVLVTRRFVTIFRPSRLFQIYTRIMAWLIVNGQKVYAPDPATRGLLPDQMNKEQLDKWSANLQVAVIYSEVCEFLQVKFREYRTSGTAVAYYLVNFFALLVTVIVLLGFANYGIYKISPSSYAVSNGHSYFDFLYYSFASLFFQRVPEINPSGGVAKIVWMFETLMALVFGGMLLSLFFAVKRNVDDALIERAITDLQQQRATVGNFVQAQYSLSLDEAIDRLESVQKGVGSLINTLRSATNRVIG